MGVRCALLGHRFDGPRIERDRDERGDHPVTVVREVRTCRRCGEVASSVSSIEPVRPSSRQSNDGSAPTEDRVASDHPPGTTTGALDGRPTGYESGDGGEQVATREGSVGGGSSGSEADDRFRCGLCGFAVGAVESPYAAGDICPQCYEGYLGREP